MVLVKVHESYRVVVAICDSDLFGKKFEDVDSLNNARQIDLTGGFFDGEERTLEEAKEIVLNYLREDATFNFVGSDSCGLAVELGLIEEKDLIEIDGVKVGLVLL